MEPICDAIDASRTSDESDRVAACHPSKPTSPFVIRCSVQRPTKPLCPVISNFGTVVCCIWERASMSRFEEKFCAAEKPGSEHRKAANYDRTRRGPTRCGTARPRTAHCWLEWQCR